MSKKWLIDNRYKIFNFTIEDKMQKFQSIPVAIAISLKMAFLCSPKPGPRIATTFKPLFNLEND